MSLSARFVVIGLAASLAACAAQPSVQAPAPTLVAANTVNERFELTAKALTRVLASDTQVAQTIALWRAISRGAVGQEIEWSSSVTADHGTAQVLRDVPLPESDRMCREYRQDSVIGNRSHRTLGQVCQQRDGSWVAISGAPEAVRNRTLSISSPCPESHHHGVAGPRRDPVCRG
jgi:surface antigen